jgi:hypothetical protein
VVGIPVGKRCFPAAADKPGTIVEPGTVLLVLQTEPVDIRIVGFVVLANGGGYGIDPAVFHAVGRREHAKKQ